MTVESPAFANQNSTYSAEQTRRAITSLLQRGATVGSIAGGIVALGDLAISATGGLTVGVAPGEAWVPGTSTATQGGYYGRVVSTVSLTAATADPSNPRIDRVVAVVTDSAYSGATNTFAVAIVTGTPTSGATLSNLSGHPAAPVDSLTLGYVLVPAGATSLTSGDISNTVLVVEPSVAVGGLSSVDVITSGTFTAANGQLLLCSPGVTIDLPAPNAGTMIGVVASPTVSGASSPVLVSGNGNLILGLDLSTSGVSSFNLGNALSRVTLFGIGGEWVILDGGPDTGWKALGVNGSLTVVTSETPASRLTSAIVRLKGGFHNGSGSTLGAGTTLATLDASTWPSVNVGFCVATTGTPSGAGQGTVLTTGQFVCADDITNGSYLYIDGATFTTS